MTNSNFSRTFQNDRNCLLPSIWDGHDSGITFTSIAAISDGETGGDQSSSELIFWKVSQILNKKYVACFKIGITCAIFIGEWLIHNNELFVHNSCKTLLYKTIHQLINCNENTNTCHKSMVAPISSFKFVPYIYVNSYDVNVLGQAPCILIFITNKNNTPKMGPISIPCHCCQIFVTWCRKCNGLHLRCRLQQFAWPVTCRYHWNINNLPQWLEMVSVPVYIYRL